MLCPPSAITFGIAARGADETCGVTRSVYASGYGEVLSTWPSAISSNSVHGTIVLAHSFHPPLASSTSAVDHFHHGSLVLHSLGDLPQVGQVRVGFQEAHDVLPSGGQRHPAQPESAGANGDIQVHMGRP